MGHPEVIVHTSACGGEKGEGDQSPAEPVATFLRRFFLLLFLLILLLLAILLFLILDLLILDPLPLLNAIGVSAVRNLAGGDVMRPYVVWVLAVRDRAVDGSQECVILTGIPRVLWVRAFWVCARNLGIGHSVSVRVWPLFLRCASSAHLL